MMIAKHGRLCFLLLLILSVAANKKSSNMNLREALDQIENVVDCLLQVTSCPKSLFNIISFVTGEEEVEKRQVFDIFDNINLKMDTVNNKLDELKQTMKNFNTMFRTEIKLHEIQQQIYHIEDFYLRYESLVSDPKFDNSTLAKFVEQCTSFDHSAPDKLIKIIFANLIPNENSIDNTNVITYLKNQKRICDTKQSLKEVIKSFFKLFLLYEIKVYTMIQFSYSMRQIFRQNQHSFKSEINLTKSEHESRLDQLAESFKSYTDQASNELYNCDPPNHTNETYIELTRLIQGIILNQKNIDQNGNCYSTCSSYNHVDKTYNCNQDVWCKEQKSCKTMFDCKSIPNAKVCLSTIKSKRYDKVEASETISYNNERSCKSRSLDRSKYKIFWECAYCFCSCDEGPSINSDRYISLRAATSDLKKNRVVVGVRFIKRNRIIHLQVQEGQVGPYGFINPDTIKWVKPNNFRTTDRKTYEGQDYHRFSASEKFIDLDDIIVSEGSIITGVRFRRVGNPAHIQLEVLTSKYNYTSGNVTPYQHTHVPPYSKNRERVKIENALPSNKCVSDKNYGPNKFVEFSHSDVKTDAGQTTVPFFDSQPINTKIPMPLSGIGLYYRGNAHSNCGGFIAPKIFTYYNSKLFDYTK